MSNIWTNMYICSVDMCSFKLHFIVELFVISHKWFHILVHHRRDTPSHRSWSSRECFRVSLSSHEVFEAASNTWGFLTRHRPSVSYALCPREARHPGRTYSSPIVWGRCVLRECPTWKECHLTEKKSLNDSPIIWVISRRIVSIWTFMHPYEVSAFHNSIYTFQLSPVTLHVPITITRRKILTKDHIIAQTNSSVWKLLVLVH